MALSVTGGWGVVLSGITTQEPLPFRSGKLSQLRGSGHVKPMVFKGSSQSRLTLLQSERHGRIGVCDSVQIGANMEQRKNAKSSEQAIFIKGENRESSRDTRCCIVGFSIVLLYDKPWQKGIVNGEHLCWPRQGVTTKIIARITTATRKRTKLAALKIPAFISVASVEPAGQKKHNIPCRSTF